jgi:hypothetical protein
MNTQTETYEDSKYHYAINTSGVYYHYHNLGNRLGSI